MTYKENKEWRKKNPDKRSKERKKYYNKTSGHASRNCHRRWSDADSRMILQSLDLTDTLLHEILGRSVQAIQNKRHEMRRKEHDKT